MKIMAKYVWVAKVTIEAKSEEESYIKLVDVDTHDLYWELKEVED